jgi:hypothetical protein
MREFRPHWRWVAVPLGLIVALTSCTYATIQRLSPDEQAEFHIYRKVMTASQERAYLSKATTAERTAYLNSGNRVDV